MTLSRAYAALAVGLPLVVIAVASTSPHEAKPMRVGVRFDSDSRVDTVLHRGCADCHSNETQWPWYACVRPIGWFIHRDVMKAREHLNFSDKPALSTNEREEIYDAVADGSMPPKPYLLLHPEARLSSADLGILSSWSKW